MTSVWIRKAYDHRNSTISTDEARSDQGRLRL